MEEFLYEFGPDIEEAYAAAGYISCEELKQQREDEEFY